MFAAIETAEMRDFGEPARSWTVKVTALPVVLATVIWKIQVSVVETEVVESGTTWRAWDMLMFPTLNFVEFEAPIATGMGELMREIPRRMRRANMIVFWKRSILKFKPSLLYDIPLSFPLG